MGKITFSSDLTPAQAKFAAPDEGRTLVASNGQAEILLIQIGEGGHWEAYTSEFSIGDHYATRGDAMSFAFTWLTEELEENA